ncbi:MAG: hypothetical protein KDK70_28835, partial [Myxococcales bacterium]|nr:hypothetical protein [Myxococcales bacterium]
MEVVGEDPSARVRIVELDAPVPIIEPRLREWSQDFSLPTVVRNAFSPPKIEPALFLPPDRLLYADVGKVGEFRDFNGQYPWSRIWARMEAGEDVYGSLGTGTPNLDEVTVGVIGALKRRILPAGTFASHENPGHVIFGSTSRRQTTTGWHNAVDANLLFQLHGTKDLYSIEQLPPTFHPVGIGAYTFLVERERSGSGAARRDDDQQHLFEISACVTLRPGDMLINTPYSWHAVRIDGFNISLSLRGDRADVMAWLAFRYFDGNIDHPMLASFANLFEAVTYGTPTIRAERRPGLRALVRDATRRAAVTRRRLESWLGSKAP